MVESRTASSTRGISFLYTLDMARIAPYLVFVVSFAVYLVTLAPTVYRLDSAELSAAAYNLGVPHATGYPLYLLLGKAFTYLPIADVGYRLNLMSAVFAAGGVTVLYQLSFLVTNRFTTSFAVAYSLAFSYYFWASAVVAEVYTLHVFLTGLTVYLLVKWDKGKDNRLLFAALFVWGLSFGNHMSTVLMGPAVAFFLVRGLQQNRISAATVLLAVPVFILPLALYFYLPWRYSADAIPYVLGHYDSFGELIRVNHTTIGGMWQTITAQQFESLMFAYGPTGYIEQMGDAAYWLFGNFLGLGILFGLLGIVANFKNDRPRLVFIGLVFVSNIIFFSSYGALDKQVMFLPVYFCWAIWMGEGFEYTVVLIDRYRAGNRDTRRWRLANQKIWAAHRGKLVFALPLAALMVNFYFIDVRSDTSVRDRSEAMLESFEPGALVLARWPDAAPMSYLQIVDDQRPDVQVINRFLISPQDEALLIKRSLKTRAVYVYGPKPILDFAHRTVAAERGVDRGRRFYLGPG